MTEVQAAEVIRIVLADQRLNVLNEVRALVGEQRREAMQGDLMSDSLMVDALDVLDAKLNTLMQRGG